MATTPEPWNVSPRKNPRAVEIHASGGYIVATVWGGGELSEQIDDDARLIALAPELRDLVRMFALTIEDRLIEDPAFEQARALLARLES